ncbi:MAG: hypothetical protein SXG53_17555 [Pseudomonadota bacterium]|nr:hypothetical protein [Pseudomonadota bacterium]
MPSLSAALGDTTQLTCGYTLGDTYFRGFAAAAPLAPITSNLQNPIYVPEPAAPRGANFSGVNETQVRGWVAMVEQRWLDERIGVLGGVRRARIAMTARAIHE